MKRIDRMLAWVIQFAGGTAQQQRQRDSGLTVWDFCDSAEEREIQVELEKIRNEQPRVVGPPSAESAGEQECLTLLVEPGKSDF